MIDWEAKHAICPQGQRSVVGVERPDRHGHAMIWIAFSKPVCGLHPPSGADARCEYAPGTPHSRARPLHCPPGRAGPAGDGYLKRVNARRAGIEGTIAQGTRMGDLQHSRYIELVNTRLMYLLTAVALNFMRVTAWFAEIPERRARLGARCTRRRRMATYWNVGLPGTS
jgi:transposase